MLSLLHLLMQNGIRSWNIHRYTHIHTDLKYPYKYFKMRYDTLYANKICYC